MESALHIAILASECGTGKTFVSILALYYRIRLHRQNMRADPARAEYKPSFLICPPATLD